jgi:hypothetical protein
MATLLPIAGLVIAWFLTRLIGKIETDLKQLNATLNGLTERLTIMEVVQQYAVPLPTERESAAYPLRRRKTDKQPQVQL